VEVKNMNLIHQEHIQTTEKYCEQCGKKLHDSYPHELCPFCRDQNLFNEVKDYIRENNVREQDVADHFNISLQKVRSWIREGRIQYKGEAKESISGVYCRFCGKPINFGVACSECHSLQNLQVVAMQKKEDSGAMRFLGK
jgi:RNA polymerase subunit RPABC4/transcription elongation factor Spt4